MQFVSTLRNTRNVAIGTAGGASGTLKIYSGSPPGIANAVSGTLLSTLTAVTYSSTGGVNTIAATPDSSAAATGTPGYARINTSVPAGIIEGSAGVGVAGATGTVTVSAGAVATVPTGTAGSGYPAGTYSLVCLVSGGSGNDAVVLANIASGAIASYSIVAGGFNYSTAPTVTPPPPFDFTFSTTVSLGGTVTLSSGTITEGNI